MISRNDPCWCGSGKKWKKCHYPEVGAESGATLAKKYMDEYGILLKTEEQVTGIRKACQFAATVLKKTCAMAKKGVTTKELSDFAQKLHDEAGAIAAALNYGEPPFPAGICTSLNEEVCHGIPDDKPLKECDILKIDMASIVNG